MRPIALIYLLVVGGLSLATLMTSPSLGSPILAPVDHAQAQAAVEIASAD